MLLVTGGAASGKSAYAEEMLLRLAGTVPDAPRIYLATMDGNGSGPEAAARIAKHRQARRGKGFRTIERARDLSGLRLPYGSCILLEDMGNLCANELFPPDEPCKVLRHAEEAVLNGVKSVWTRARHMVVVTNEVFSGGPSRFSGTADYLRLLGRVNGQLARLSDGVCEVVCGIPVYYKGAKLFGLSQTPSG